MIFIGETAALGASLAWTLSGLMTERTTRKADATDLNLVVKILGYVLISLLALWAGGSLFPIGVSLAAWFWLGLSGILGFSLGDSFLFRSYQLIGTKVTMLIFATNPVITALLGWLLFGEELTLFNLLGMVLVLSGVILVILEGSGGKLKLRFSGLGILVAALGALGQAAATLLSKQGMVGLDVFTTTQVRLIAAIPVLLLLVSRNGKTSRLEVFKERRLFGEAFLNTFLSIGLGVSFSMVAIANTKAAIASTLMSVSPVMVIPITVFLQHQRLDWRELAGALLSILGIAILFIR